VFTLEKEEMYGEFFDIPKPDSVVFTGWFSTGNVFRSGCTFSRGHGKVFYFQPGHETNPTYKNEIVGQILRNAVRWAAPQKEIFDEIDCPWETEYIEKKYQK
ncbi:MAG: ThuA domain-containing protein, partial [Clostridia bacterium]|nr:ThuA domain-containing protein [Clostridia bacterium]